MRSIRLRTRYVLTVLAVGLVLTVALALVNVAGEDHARQHLETVLDQASRQSGADPASTLANVRQEILALVPHFYASRLPLILGIGIGLSLLAAWITALLIARIDRAMSGLAASAERIGRGLTSEPVPSSGVPEIANLERALERMREALAGTTISRDYLNTLLNSMSDAVLVVAPDGRVRTVNAAAAEMLGAERDSLAGV
jgi:signal transduction histidine kinase